MTFNMRNIALAIVLSGLSQALAAQDLLASPAETYLGSVNEAAKSQSIGDLDIATRALIENQRVSTQAKFDTLWKAYQMYRTVPTLAAYTVSAIGFLKPVDQLQALKDEFTRKDTPSKNRVQLVQAIAGIYRAPSAGPALTDADQIRNSDVLLFLQHAAADQDSDVARAAVLAYSRAVPGPRAAALIHQANQQGALGAEHFMRESIIQIPALPAADQDATIDSILVLGGLRANGPEAVTLTRLLGAYLKSEKFTESIGAGSRQKLDAFLLAQEPGRTPGWASGGFPYVDYNNWLEARGRLAGVSDSAMPDFMLGQLLGSSSGGEQVAAVMAAQFGPTIASKATEPQRKQLLQRLSNTGQVSLLPGVGQHDLHARAVQMLAR
ncbi:MAG: hypothetical protein ACODTU_06410 [Pigmentiphaga sp.]|uniref:hypothetical protein n=1 Tax=Pigmentiphaga sp. TaxID=1977564 RepID=UPI003B5308C2